MKKALALLLTLALLAGMFTACGKNKTDNTDDRQNGSDSSVVADPDDSADEADDTPDAAPDEPSEAENEDTEAATAPIVKKTQVAEPLDGDGGKALEPALGEVQDVAFFADGRLDYHDVSISNGFNVRSITGNASDLEVYRAYIQYLTENGFEIVGESNAEYPKTQKYFYSTTLDYTRSDMKKRAALTFDDKKPSGNISLYCTVERSNLKGSVFYTPELTLRDLGARFGNKNADLSYAGASAYAGLYSDGVNYETSDGRLKTKLGEAMVIYGGSTYTVPTDATRNESLETLNLFVRDYYRADSLAFRYRENYLMQGDVMTHQELYAESNYASILEDYFKTIDDVDKWNWQTGLVFCHDDKYVTLTEDQYGGITKAFVRALVYEKGKVAVLYIAAEFESAPTSIEALCAFDLTQLNNGGSQPSGGSSGSSGGSGGRSGVPCSRCIDGKVDCDECNGTGQIERYAAGGGTIKSGCTKCRGSRKIPCTSCGGDGWLE